MDARKHILMVNWVSNGNGVSEILALDVKALLNLAARPLVDGFTGETLANELRARGAVLSDAIGEDGAVVPALQAFDQRTGNTTFLAHYQAGKLQDPANGGPAVRLFDGQTGIRTEFGHYSAGKLQDPASGKPALQEFDRQTGNRTFLAHYQADEIQDPVSSEPALQEFDAQTGIRTEFGHCQAGNLQDPASGEPAVQTFDAQTGALLRAIRYQPGRRPEELSERELIELQLTAGTVVLPEALRQYARPSLRPA